MQLEMLKNYFDTEIKLILTQLIHVVKIFVVVISH